MAGMSGTELLAARRWAEAHAAFEAARAEEETPEALEGLGQAARWLHDEQGAVRAHDRAYRLYRARGDDRGATRMAIQLAMHAYNFRGDMAEARGWVERGRRLVSDVEEDCPEAGWILMMDAHLALLLDHDVEGAIRLAEEATEIGRRVGDADVEFFGLGVHGLALVTEGRVPDGMRLLDEAATAATAGEVADLDALQTIYCYLIYACKRVRDFDRAESWCARVRETSERYGDRLSFSICRTHYADVLLWRGAWADCEAELGSAEREFQELNERRLGDVVARLGELRRRQGREQEAAALFARAESHPVSVYGRAAMSLAHGDPDGARHLVERYMRRLGPSERTERVAALEVLVRAAVQAGDVEDADAARDDLVAIAGEIGSDGMRAAAAMAQGLVGEAREDLDAARRAFEDAVDLYDRGAPYEAARARMDLARVLGRLGRDSASHEQLDAAAAILKRLAAGATAPAPADEAGLTRREQEVLRLVARGMSNQEIAAELVLSVRTVERHIASIYAKIGVAGRSARAAAATYAASAGIA